jgi:hypothetical protein
VSLFITNDNHQQRRPCHQQRLSQSQRQTHHHREDHCISPQIYADLLPPTQISDTSTADLQLQQPNQRHEPPATATQKPTTASTDWCFTAARAAQQIFVCHHPQCPRLQQRQRFNRPPSNSDITDITALSSHRRSQAESQIHLSCVVAVSSGNKLQKARKKETEALHTK